MATDDSNNNQGGNDNAADGDSDASANADQNTRSEFNRKLANMSEQIAQMNAGFAQVLETMRSGQGAQPQPGTPPKPLKDMVFDDPDQFVNTVVKQAEQRASQIVDQRVQVNTETQSIISDLQSKYPEFMDPKSEVTKHALAAAQRQPAGLRGTPQGAKLAMMDAVAQYDLVPQSKRGRTAQGGNPDDFVAGSTSAGAGGGQSRRSRESEGAKGVDPMTLAFAEAIGTDLSDPKRIEGLAAASKRKNWNRYG